MKYNSPKKYKPKFLAPRQGFTETVFGYWVFALLFWETLLHAAVFGEFSGELGYIVGFSVSSDILNQAYYNFVFGKGEITVGHQGWNS